MILTRSTRLPLALLAALAVCALTGCGGARARYGSHLQRGQESSRAAISTRPGVEFRNAVQIEPKSAPGLYFVGRVAEARNNIREAFGYYQAAIDRGSAVRHCPRPRRQDVGFCGRCQAGIGSRCPGTGRAPGQRGSAGRAGGGTPTVEGAGCGTSGCRARRAARSRK